MFWPRGATKVLSKRPSLRRVESAWMRPAVNRLERAYPFAFAADCRRVSAPLGMFDLPARMKNARRASPIKR